MSEKPIAERLQVKKGRRLAVIGAPTGLDLVTDRSDQRTTPADADVVLLFVANHAALVTMLPKMLVGTKPQAILWLAYPKLTSKLALDLNRDIIRSLAPGYGVDTVSQIAIDADWSALRLKRISLLAQPSSHAG